MMLPALWMRERAKNLFVVLHKGGLLSPLTSYLGGKMRLFFSLSALVLGGLVACGGSNNNGDIGGPPGSGLADGGPDPSGEAGTASGADGGGEGGTTDGGGKGDGGIDGSVKDTRIDPIEVGHAWTYNVSVIGFYPACSNGVFVSNTLSSSTVDGKTALSVQSLCENAGVYKYSVDGDHVYAYLNGAWKTSLDAPVADGHTWSDGFLNYKWESKGSVTTPAGTFSDCWSATTVASYTSYIVLCRGVGPVKWHYEDGLGAGYEAILTAKNF